MHRTNLLACDEAETLLAVADGNSLLVYSGDDGQPLWKAECGGTVLCIGATEEEVVTLDDGGLLVWWDGQTGERSDEVEIEGEPKAFAADRDGVVALLTEEGVQIVDPGDEIRHLALRGGRSVAWSSDGAQLAVGGRDGTLHLFDEASLEPLATGVTFPGSITSLAGLPDGGWVVLCGGGLHLVDEDGEGASPLLSIPTEAGEKPKADCLLVSSDGTVLGCRAGAGRALVFDRVSGAQAARIAYPARRLLGVAFGTKNRLLVALDGGAVQRVNLRTGVVRQLPGHPGRSLEAELPEVTVSQLERRARTARSPHAGSGPHRRGHAVTEADVPVPDRQTLGMLGAVALATLTMWGAAKFACNAHPPESKRPREVGTVELASTPKDAAIEFVHRLATYEFEGALQLAESVPAAEVEQQLHACEEAGKAACDAKRKQVAGKVLTTAELLSQAGKSAKARVTSQGPEGTRVYSLDLVNVPPIWRVSRFSPEPG